MKRNFFRRFGALALALTLALSLSLVAPAWAASADPPVAVISVELDKYDLPLKVDDLGTLTATVLPEDATDQQVTWTSNNTNVVEIRNPTTFSGRPVNLKAKAKGQAIITATAGTISANCSVIVSEKTIEVTSVTLNPASKSLTTGENFSLTVTVGPSDATDKTVTWSVDRPNVIDWTPPSTGDTATVTAKTPGTARITARAGNQTATCTVTVNAPTVAVTGVTLKDGNKTLTSSDTITLTRATTQGRTRTLTAEVAPDGATNKNVTWSSDDTSIATVSNNGTVTAVRGGETTITVTTAEGNFSASCKVKVDAPVTGVRVDPSTLTLPTGGSGKLTATVQPEDANNKTVKWSSSNPNVVTVDPNTGELAAGSGSGTATITATTDDGGKTATCTVTVAKSASSVAMNPTEITLPVGGSTELTATLAPPDATDTVTWTSSKANTAYVTSDGKVDASGKVKGRVTAGSAAGTATITVRAGSATDTCAVTVVSMALNPTQLRLPVGASQSLSAVFTPSSYTGSTVTWSSANETIATVDTSGKVTAKGIGTTVVKATTTVGGVTLESSCTVFVSAAVIPIEKLTLDPATLTLSKGMQPVKLTPKFEPENATTQTVAWSSSDPAVATVSRDGYVTAVGEGKATITATAGEKKGTCAVTVGIASVTGVSIVTYSDDNPLILDPGKAEAVTATVNPFGVDQTVTWKSGDEKIATVAADGTVTAVGVGKTTITATAKADTTKSATCPVEVSGVVLDKDSLPGTMFLNDSHPVKLQTFGNASKANAKRNWTSSNPGVAAVNTAGTILARGYGTAKISVTYVVGNSVYEVQGSPFEVTVEENDGTILRGNATAGAPYVFTDIMPELNAICRSVTGYALSHVTNVQVPTSEGVLYYNHVSSDDTGFGVGATEYYYYNEGTVGQRYMSGLTFVPNSDFNGETTITYAGYNTEGTRYAGKIRLTVTGSGNVTFITKAGQALTFTSTSFSAASRSETGRDIDSVSFVLPNAAKGTLYYGHATNGQYRYNVTEQERYSRSRTPYLDQVTFVPAENYIGTLTMPFYGEDTMGTAFNGKIHIIVVPSRPEGQREELTTIALRGTTVDFDKFDFQAVCRDILGQTLSYVRFTPPASSVGMLCYNYSSSGQYDSLVNANTRYYPSRSPKLADLTFVPADERIAPVTIDFVGYSTSGRSFEGTVTIYYRDTNSGDDVITYAVSSGQAVPFEPADFSKLCEAVTGKALSRIVFQTLPNSSDGTLYYNYNGTSSTGTRVTTKTNLYRSNLSGVAFAPRSDFTGTVEMEFIGYDVSGGRFTGTVRINVEEGNTTLRYYVDAGSSVSFRGSDFNNICRQATDGNLNYVRFQLPRTTEGRLYYRYNSSATARGTVSASSSYYYSTSGSNKLDNVYFTAASNYTGTVRIDYTGFSTSGARFTGTVAISVSYPTGAVLSYNSDALPFTIPGADLRSACASGLERELSYIMINALPEAEEGRLYYDYVGQGTGTAASTSTRYYPDREPYLNRLVFVPRAGYSGTVSLPYTGYDTRGDTMSGTINITVTQATTSVFTDMSRHVWAIPSVDFLYSSGVVKGTGSNRFDPVSNVRRCDFVLMLTRMYNLPAAGTRSFDDVPEDQYYSAAIASARAQNVITGENGRFRPEEPITREDAMVFLYNAMRCANQSVPAGSSEELYAFADYNSVSESARDAITSMIHMGVLLGDDYRRINPASPITRAETAAILHRAMTL